MINFIYFWFNNYVFDYSNRRIEVRVSVISDKYYFFFFVNIDVFSISFFYDGMNGFFIFIDDFVKVFFWYCDGSDARGIFVRGVRGRRVIFFYFVEDVYEFFLCFFECGFYDIDCDIFDFDIYLECGDIVFVVCNFKIYVVERVFRV